MQALGRDGFEATQCGRRIIEAELIGSDDEVGGFRAFVIALCKSGK